MNTYEIAKEIEALRSLNLEEEFDETTGELIDNSEELRQLCDEIELKRDDKLKGIEYIKREYQAMNTTIDAEIKRLQDRKKKFVKNIDKLSNLQTYLLGGNKVETDLFTFSFRKSTSMTLTDETIVDKKYKIVATVTQTTIDKKSLKSDMVENQAKIDAITKSDEDEDTKNKLIEALKIKGAELVIKNNLQVK